MYVTSRHGTLNGTATEFEFPAVDYELEVILMAIGPKPIYARLDGATAVIEGDDSIVVPGGTAREFKIEQLNISGGEKGYKASIIGADGGEVTKFALELKRRINNS